MNEEIVRAPDAASFQVVFRLGRRDRAHYHHVALSWDSAIFYRCSFRPGGFLDQLSTLFQCFHWSGKLLLLFCCTGRKTMTLAPNAACEN